MRLSPPRTLLRRPLEEGTAPAGGSVGACRRPGPRGSAAATRGAGATGRQTAAFLASLPRAGRRPRGCKGHREAGGARSGAKRVSDGNAQGRHGGGLGYPAAARLGSRSTSVPRGRKRPVLPHRVVVRVLGPAESVRRTGGPGGAFQRVGSRGPGAGACLRSYPPELHPLWPRTSLQGLKILPGGF